jgi:hypothetical protein
VGLPSRTADQRAAADAREDEPQRISHVDENDESRAGSLLAEFRNEAHRARRGRSEADAGEEPQATSCGTLVAKTVRTVNRPKAAVATAIFVPKRRVANGMPKLPISNPKNTAEKIAPNTAWAVAILRENGHDEADDLSVETVEKHQQRAEGDDEIPPADSATVDDVVDVDFPYFHIVLLALKEKVLLRVLHFLAGLKVMARMGGHSVPLKRA